MTIINENRERIEIVVHIISDYTGHFQYRIDDIYITPYRKRKPVSLAAKIRDRYEYRVLGREKRAEYIRNEYLKYCTEEQILQAVQEEYRKMEPKSENIVYRI